jgi:nucleoid-associated protein YgaU
VHTVRAGDSLQSIAYEHYRDATRWREIAEANGIDDPMHLGSGVALTVPLVSA